MPSEQRLQVVIMKKLTQAASAVGDDVHLVPFLHCEETAFNYQMITPLYDEDLSKMVRRGRTEYKKGHPDPVALVTKQVAIGLSFMHDNRIMHRDLSAMNIFIKYPGCSNNNIPP